MRAPQFFFVKFRKKYAWNIRVYTVIIRENMEEMHLMGKTIKAWCEKFLVTGSVNQDVLIHCFGRKD